MKPERTYKHYRGLNDANVIATPHLRRIGEVLDAMLPREGEKGIGLVHGDAGLGKTFGVGTHLMRVQKQVELIRLVATVRPSEKRVLSQILQETTGVPAEGTLYDLYDQAKVELARKPRLLVIDEAQNLRGEAIAAVRHLHDDDNADFAWLLVGGNKTWEVLSGFPMLEDRVDEREQLTPLSEKQVLTYIPQYHPIYRSLDPELLLMIDEYEAHGRFRDWARFTRKAALLCEERDSELDEDMIAHIFVSRAGAVGV